MNIGNKKIRFYILLSLMIVTPIGFASKFYNGFGAKWFNDSFGGLLYEVFWCLVISLIFIKIKSWKIALFVFIITCGLEFLQLWHPIFLEVIRGTFIGRTILGTTFVSSDFIYYLFGSLFGWVLLERIKNSTSS